MNAKVAVGQKLYEPEWRRSGVREYEVVSIGRKWIQLSGGDRCDFNLLRDCCGYPPKQLYTNIEEYEAERRLSAAWRDLCRDLDRARRPDGITVADINAIRAKLSLQVLDVEGQPC